MNKKVQKQVLETVLYNGLDKDDYVAIMDKSKQIGQCGMFIYCARLLVEEGYLIIKTNSDDTEGTILDNREAEYLSLKGASLLAELQHPLRHWIGRNWFVLLVAILSSYSAALSAALLIMMQFK